MQLGDDRFEKMHCDVANNYGGCPNWGLNRELVNPRIEIGFVCVGYWNPSMDNCLSCMNICYSCADGSSLCNQFCYEIYPNCSQCDYNSCSQCLSGFYFQPGTTTCSSTCPTYYKPSDSPIPGVCMSCDVAYSGCLTCNLNGCLTCNSNIGVYFQPDTPACLSTCPSTHI